MNLFDPFLSRRGLLRGGLALGATALLAPGVFAEELARTPSVTEGPFYPPRLPLDTDNDLIIINKSLTPAVGTITHLSGRVLSLAGEPINNATVEIWQCDNNGVYIAEGNRGGRADRNFQGFGTFTTGTKGEYRFRTIKPVPYTGRTPHIHVKVKKGGKELLTTQIFVNGHAQNARDGVLRGIRDPLERELVLVDFKPIKTSKIGEVSAKFDIVVGLTPDERPRRGRRS
jgi:protocatechuate 3,4-dioxygenase beta subunit